MRLFVRPGVKIKNYKTIIKKLPLLLLPYNFYLPRIFKVRRKGTGHLKNEVLSQRHIITPSPVDLIPGSFRYEAVKKKR